MTSFFRQNKDLSIAIVVSWQIPPIENFKNEWGEKLNPTIREDEPSFLARIRSCQFQSAKEEMIETDITKSELENFKNEWAEKWNPTIREETGIKSHALFF